MASNYFNNSQPAIIKKGMLLHQKALIEQHYAFLHCRLEKNVLVCRGTISCPDYKNTYKIEIRCVYGKEPHSKILEPSDIVPCREIHMYDDHSLCLHYPSDKKWSAWTPIYKYSIPWVVEWTHYYELFLINGGVWEGPESPVHFTNHDKNIAIDL